MALSQTTTSLNAHANSQAWHAMSAADGSFDATEVSLNVVFAGTPPQHVLQQQHANPVVQKGAIYAHYNLESVIALERRISSDGISEDTGEDEFKCLSDEIDSFVTPERQSFSELIPQGATDIFEKEASSSGLSNGVGVDVAFLQSSSHLALPMTGLSPVELISDLMRSELRAKILTRLPCPEKEFQSEEPVTMDFLPRALLLSDAKISYTFTDSIQLVAICGQLLLHQQQGTVEHAHGLIALGFWDRQQQLDARLEQVFKGMSIHDPYALIFQDPMACFTVLAAQASALMLFNSSRTAPWGTKDGNMIAKGREERAMAAAQQMITLSKALIELSYFKIHPFTPVLLYFCGDFLVSNHHLDPTFEMRLTIQNVLQALSPVNFNAQECLDRLHMGN
ncbi:hypothetical protein EKO04_003887 [Ascochyta lentis]|uniref:Uncharacterized protein n=1 Tax=Ascochyta lentis TaxID=205686 RepID=A0A8H7J949_9PLEO|nr:hypothetical protein EKO04_003887 [Ascochyta lentis]